MASASEIKNLLDNELQLEKLGKNFEDINNNVIKFFQKLFVEQLNFEFRGGQFGEIGEDIPIDDWNKASEAQSAFLIAEMEEFRIVYITLKKISRYRERFAISSLNRGKWTKKGEYICIFYAENSTTWDMVCPHFYEGRMILRRYILGDGENHRTISSNLSSMDASLTEPLFDRVQEAFKVKVVTKEFYDRYKDYFNRIKFSLTNQKINIINAKKFAHLLLNRLMFIYFIQKKKWINYDKNFLFNFLKMYKTSGESNQFYEKWLSTLFFTAMSEPIEKKSIILFDKSINNILNNIPFLNGGLFEKDDVDKLIFSLKDDLIIDIIENFLEEYNFTITEESAYDLDIAIDPAMLGKIYESLIAEEERGKSGIFYTPRIEVDLMCRIGFFEYFLNDKYNCLAKDKKIIRKELINFIFTPIEDWNMEESSKYEYLRKFLLNVSVVDPACGSGAFLVGALQIILELLRKLGLTANYSLRESIIYNSINGVDIKDWAVRMAEFRLWLALIESEEKIPDKTPILPNFSFKLKCGDSLIQQIEDVPVDFKLVRKNLTKNIKDKISELRKLKQEYFEGKKIEPQVILKTQIEIVIELLNERIFKLENQKKKVGQRTLVDNKLTKESKKKIDLINNNIEVIKNVREKISKLKDLNLLFIWDINFIEIMLEGGFDIVIANPPYVSKNEIINPKLDPEEILILDSEKISALRQKYVENLGDFIQNNYKYKISSSCDLYVYFFYKGIELLNPNGTMVYISSNSWLNVGFGGELQKAILKYGKLKYIFENLIQRTFTEAEVNTIITVLNKKININEIYGVSKFIAFNTKFEDISTSQYHEIINIDEKDQKFNFLQEEIAFFDSDIYKKIKVSHKLLGKFGGKIAQSGRKNVYLLEDYDFSKWSIFLLADYIFFKIINQENIICQLDKYNNIYLGMTSGYNNFFYLKQEQIEILEIEDKFVKSLIKSPRELKSPFIDINNLKLSVFLVDKAKSELKGTKALKYIESDEKKSKPIYKRPFFAKKYKTKSRQEWYKLDPKRGRILLPNLIDKIHKVSINSQNYPVDKKLICCDPKRKKYEKATFLILYSTFMIYIKEIIGSTSLGGGALDVSTTDYKKLYFIELNNLNEEILNNFNTLFDEFENYNFSTTFEELGTDNVTKFKIENVIEQRKKVDKIILEKIFGLNKDEQIKVYTNVIKLLKNRIERSKSV